MASLISCPYNSAHQILKERLQIHLVKCAKNYPNADKLKCPFDATHIVKAIELEHHILTCPSSGNIRSYKYSLEPERKVGVISIEQAIEMETLTSEEDWNGNYPSYNPEVVTENRNVSRMLIGAAPAKRRQHQMAERARLCSLDENADSSRPSSSFDKTNHEKPLRKPRNVAKAMSITFDENSVDQISESIENMIRRFQKIDVDKPTCVRTEKNPENVLEPNPTDLHSKEEEEELNFVDPRTTKEKRFRNPLDNQKTIGIKLKNKQDDRKSEKEINVPVESKVDSNTDVKENLLRIGGRAAKSKTPKKVSRGRGFSILSENTKRLDLSSNSNNSVIYGYDDGEKIDLNFKDESPS